MTLLDQTNPDETREQAIDAAFRWIKYEQTHTPDGVLELDRTFVENLFGAAHSAGHLQWTGETPAVGANTTGLDPDLVDAVEKLQQIRGEYRNRSYAVMNRIAQLAGLSPA